MRVGVFMSARESGKNTLFFIGRFEPYHKGHAAVVEAALATYPEADIVLAVGSADTDGLDPKNPWTFEERKEMILAELKLRYPPAVLSRIRIDGVQDFSSDGAWTCAVKAAVVGEREFSPALKPYLTNPHMKKILISYFENPGQVVSSPEFQKIANLVERLEAEFRKCNPIITGFEKDSSSYYIKTCFPGIYFQDVQYYQPEGIGGLDATKIRNLYFAGQLWEHPGFVQEIPKGILDFLKKFEREPRFAELRHHHENKLTQSGLPFFGESSVGLPTRDSIGKLPPKGQAPAGPLP